MSGCLTEFVAERIAREPDGRLRCDISRCAKRVEGYAVFVWGAAALCKKHLEEEERAMVKESDGH